MEDVSVPHTAVGLVLPGNALVGTAGNWALRCCAREISHPWASLQLAEDAPEKVMEKSS